MTRCTVTPVHGRRFVSKLAWRTAAFAFLVATMAAAAPARAQGTGFNTPLPTCDDPAALQEIANLFAQKESTFWNSALQIVDFRHVHQLAVRSWAVHTIPRRFCSGHVLVSDGIKRRLNYSIIENAGMIGASWGVEWCVVGLDRNWAYNPACRAALP
jgi:hypothetical protein